jgi:plastocyanin
VRSVASGTARLGVSSASAATTDSTVVITATNFEFHPATVTVPVGTTVAWVDSLGNHTIELDDKSFVSKPLLKGMRATYRFEKAGKFTYHCQLHGDVGGVGMAGTIVVTAP